MFFVFREERSKIQVDSNAYAIFQSWPDLLPVGISRVITMSLSIFQRSSKRFCINMSVLGGRLSTKITIYRDKTKTGNLRDSS